MLIAPDFGFIFIHIPKTAGTSVSAALEPLAGYRAPSLWVKLRRRWPGPLPPRSDHFSAHAKASAVRSRIGARVFDGFHSFCFVRNPYSHAFSHYGHLRRFRHERIARKVRQMDFASYLTWRESGARHRHWHHVERVVFMGDQSGFVTDVGGRVLVSQICHFERLGAEMAGLVALLGLPPIDLPHRHNSGRGLGAQDHAALTPDAIASINRIYAADFDRFGYRRATSAEGVFASLSAGPAPLI
jgi:hypothetical protein